MNAWIKPVQLMGKHVVLKPMTHDHVEGLKLAVSDGELWNLWYTHIPGPSEVESYVDMALSQQQAGQSIPFVICDPDSGNILGSTRYCHIDHDNKRVEIGYTWYAKSVQRTAVNTQCKFLLLTHAFEALDCIAVEFRTHWHNLASRKAILRLGAKQDGVLRNHQMMPDGGYRDTVVFSIINQEWPVVKTSLAFKLSAKS